MMKPCFLYGRKKKLLRVVEFVRQNHHIYIDTRSVLFAYYCHIDVMIHIKACFLLSTM